MKLLLKLEHLGFFMAGILLYAQGIYPWWLFPLVLLYPDLGMLGYLINSRWGAYIYNLAHHYGIGLLLTGAWYFLGLEICLLLGSVQLAHVGLDRFLGYGLKHTKGFKHTHLGKIGKREHG